MKNRIHFIDYLRNFAFVLIMLYHMLFQLSLDGICPTGLVEPFYAGENIHIGTLGVSLFFMISGFCLMYESRQGFDCRTFYWKRFLRICIPFYVVDAGVYLYEIVGTHGHVFSEKIPAWRIIFTLFASDHCVDMLGLKTFTLGIGEWFLGYLVFMYLLFPLLLFFTRKAPRIYFILFAVCVAIMDIFCGASVNMRMNFGAKLFEFVIGMYFALYWKNIKKEIIVPAFGILLFFIFYPSAIPLPEGLCILLPALCVFLLASQGEPVLRKFTKANDCMQKLGQYTFEYYLCHHVIIFGITGFFSSRTYGRTSVIWILLLEIGITSIVTIVVKFMVNKVLIMIRRLVSCRSLYPAGR